MNKQQLIEELRDLILVSEGKTREGVTGRVGAKFFGSDDHYNIECNLDGPITIVRVLKAINKQEGAIYEIQLVDGNLGIPVHHGFDMAEWNLSNDTAEAQTEVTLRGIIEVLKENELSSNPR